ncbi:hypothetical protein GF322_00380 [Candidatus Dependentiae bacterium]|nr:hypothetical protein [Candidatus Dependentiae bacterium]
MKILNIIFFISLILFTQNGLTTKISDKDTQELKIITLKPEESCWLKYYDPMEKTLNLSNTKITEDEFEQQLPEIFNFCTIHKIQRLICENINLSNIPENFINDFKNHPSLLYLSLKGNLFLNENKLSTNLQYDNIIPQIILDLIEKRLGYISNHLEDGMENLENLNKKKIVKRIDFTDNIYLIIPLAYTKDFFHIIKNIFYKALYTISGIIIGLTPYTIDFLVKRYADQSSEESNFLNSTSTA